MKQLATDREQSESARSAEWQRRQDAERAALEQQLNDERIRCDRLIAYVGVGV